MIDTFSSFHYGISIDSESKFLDFNEGSGELTAELRVGHYTLGTLCAEIEYQMERVGTQGYTVTANRVNKKITIAGGSSFSILGSTGSNAANGCYLVIGFPASDTSSTTSHTSTTSIGTEYFPQYKLQDYVAGEDNTMLRNESVMTSVSGRVEVVSFGVDQIFHMNIKFATDIYQPPSGPIANNPTGVSDLRSLMQYLIYKYEIEFFPNEDNDTNYYRLVLESAPGESKGTGYLLEEQFSKNLKGYYETGVLKFRVIED